MAIELKVIKGGGEGKDPRDVKLEKEAKEFIREMQEELLKINGLRLPDDKLFIIRLYVTATRSSHETANETIVKNLPEEDKAKALAILDVITAYWGPEAGAQAMRKVA